jgi:hypothetical protein
LCPTRSVGTCPRHSRGGNPRRSRGGHSILLAACAMIALITPSAHPQDGPERIDRGRFTVTFFAQDRQLATSLAQHAVTTDTFPGLPRPSQRVTIAVAPDERRFRDWAGSAPEWGSAVAFPDARRVVLQGRRAGSDAGDPLQVLRHELAHLALHEFQGDLPSRWFDEGYASFAAGEWGRTEMLATNVALALRGMPTLDELEESFEGGTAAAQSAYALAYRAVAEMAQLDQQHGLTLFFRYWRTERSFERAMRSAYGITSSEFERRWRSRTRRQYGMLALLGNLTIATLLLLLVLAPLYVMRRRRDRERLARMREADAAAERSAQQSALAELLGQPHTDGPP